MKKEYLMRSLLPSWNLHNKRVIVRADLNVPLVDGVIQGDQRLQGIVPTLDYIIGHGGKVILLTHIGRPTGPSPALSTKNLVPWFTKHGYAIEFANNVTDALQHSTHDQKTILLLENMRFFPGEKDNNCNFATQLAQLGDYYVDDAFGALHRADTSLTALARLFAQDKKTIGFLVERELSELNRLLDKPKRPFMLILGGGKIADKLPLIHNFLPMVDYILLGPAIVATFLQALGKPVGRSMVDSACIPLCKDLLEKAKKIDVTILFPVDYVVAMGTRSGKLETVKADEFPEQACALTVGPETVALYHDLFKEMHTIFLNGLMGLWERPETLVTTRLLFKAVSESGATTIVGGGDSVSALSQWGLTDTMSFVSTGGGATLAYLGNQNLPALDALLS